MSHQMLILLSEEGAEAERVAELTGYLREELLELDVDDVSPVPGPEPPPGARVADPAAIGGLLVGLSGSVGALIQVLHAIREWRGRFRDSRPSLRLTLDDDVLEISEASAEQVSEAFDLFVRRHSTVEA
ncbi:hypothetical protein ACF05L_09060 [Streptomyces bobili]|uniref:hypothetical protein n=1 Tax=Streptomyces bobili TaxID=67280 RepID=UPI0037020614